MSQPSAPVAFAPQQFLADVNLIQESLLFTVLVGPQAGTEWDYARRVCHDQADPVNLPACRHLSIDRTDYAGYEQYAITYACNHHPDISFVAELGPGLLEAWMLDHRDPNRTPRIVEAIQRIHSDLSFYIAGVSSRLEVPEDASPEEFMQAVLDRVEAARNPYADDTDL